MKVFIYSPSGNILIFNEEHQYIEKLENFLQDIKAAFLPDFFSKNYSIKDIEWLSVDKNNTSVISLLNKNGISKLFSFDNIPDISKEDFYPYIDNIEILNKVKFERERDMLPAPWMRP